MRRYLAFYYLSLDSAGGLFDFMGDFDDPYEAENEGLRRAHEHDLDSSVHVLDTGTGAAWFTNTFFSHSKGEWVTNRTEAPSVVEGIESMARSRKGDQT